MQFSHSFRLGKREIKFFLVCLKTTLFEGMIATMEPNVIVGGGVSGLLIARVLQEKNLSFVGFENRRASEGEVRSVLIVF